MRRSVPLQSRRASQGPSLSSKHRLKGYVPTYSRSLRFALDVRVKGIINGKLSCQSLFIRQAHGSESLSDRAQTNALGSGILLSLYVGCSHNKPEPLHGGIGDREVLNDRFEGAPITPMV